MRRLRLVTAQRTIVLDDLEPVKRYDVAAALRIDVDGIGFTARARVPRKARWACLEARTARREPWSRIDCMTLAS